MTYNPQVLSLDDLKVELEAGMSQNAIAKKYGLNPRTVERKAGVLKRRLIIPPLAEPRPDGFVVSQLTTTIGKNGVERQSIRSVPEPIDAQHQDQIPDGHTLKGVSTLVNANGEVTAQWVKTKRDDLLAHAAQEAAIRALAEGLPALPTVFLTDREYDGDLLNLYTLTDCHVGMLAWARETGEPWDLTIAANTLVQTFAQMIHESRPARRGVVNQLGDFLHFDGLQALTPTSGHLLDADSRFQKMVEVAVQILEQVIVIALQKHELIDVFCHEGNHDMASSVWLRVLFARVFRDNPRVRVEQSPNPYVALQHGKTMLGFHHGHLAKKERLPMIFAAQHSEMWGQTKFREIHTGHLHNEEVKEYPGIKIRQHPTLSAKDAYAARFGYDSLRVATSYTYSKTRGKIGSEDFYPIE